MSVCGPTTDPGRDGADGGLFPTIRPVRQETTSVRIRECGVRPGSPCEERTGSERPVQEPDLHPAIGIGAGRRRAPPQREGGYQAPNRVPPRCMLRSPGTATPFSPDTLQKTLAKLAGIPSLTSLMVGRRGLVAGVDRQTVASLGRLSWAGM